MSNSLKYEVDKSGNDMKIRDYMTDILNLSGRFTRNAAMEKRIKVNGKAVKLNYKLATGDLILVQVEKDESQNIIPEDLSIEVIYEDDDLLVVNKRPFMVVHPTKSHPIGTLSNGILYHFRKNCEGCIVRLVSRLDRDTSGLIMVAKKPICPYEFSKVYGRK